ncbi:hypothetical protein THRCLA_01089 [Thraustotheca clavata]|uniref:BZIP domain-containing protein n=1 Tax=Thraustotheca clavata TaxID=74557 RepID=A0A1W0A9B4_9STRA|nr:hypothetical protein THRCLA_01089 [Thraustotheca clavata]
MSKAPGNEEIFENLASSTLMLDDIYDVNDASSVSGQSGMDLSDFDEEMPLFELEPLLDIVKPKSTRERFEVIDSDQASSSSSMASPVSSQKERGKSNKKGSKVASEAYDKKKQYNRDRNRRFRQMEKQEAAQLAQQIQDLQSQLKVITTTKKRSQSEDEDMSNELLPWKEVATVFKTMKLESQEKKSTLESKVRKYKEIACIMNSWVSKSMSIPNFTDPFKQSWRNSSLMAHESSRRLGFDWITKQLYYNIDAVIQHCGLPSNMKPCSEVHVFPLEDDPSYHLVKARQRIEHGTLEEVTQTLQRLYFEKRDGILDSPDPNILYFRMKSPYGATQQYSYFQNILARQFFDEDRYVIFTHSITDDEKYPLDRIQRNWTNWTIAERLGPDQVIIKQVSIANGLRMHDKYLPFDQDPSAVLSSDPVVQFRQFEHKTHLYHQRIFAQDVLKFQQTLAQIRYENTTAQLEKEATPLTGTSPVSSPRFEL